MHRSIKKHTYCHRFGPVIDFIGPILLRPCCKSFSQPLQDHTAIVCFANQHHITIALIQLSLDRVWIRCNYSIAKHQMIDHINHKWVIIHVQSKVPIFVEMLVDYTQPCSLSTTSWSPSMPCATALTHVRQYVPSIQAEVTCASNRNRTLKTLLRTYKSCDQSNTWYL